MQLSVLITELGVCVYLSRCKGGDLAWKTIPAAGEGQEPPGSRAPFRRAPESEGEALAGCSEWPSTEQRLGGIILYKVQKAPCRWWWEFPAQTSHLNYCVCRSIHLHNDPEIGFLYLDQLPTLAACQSHMGALESPRTFREPFHQGKMPGAGTLLGFRVQPGWRNPGWGSFSRPVPSVCLVTTWRLHLFGIGLFLTVSSFQ